METTFTKVSETQLKEISVSTPIQVEKNHDRDSIKLQELRILEEITSFVAKKNEELAEVRALLAKMDELGVRSKKEIEIEELEAKIVEANAENEAIIAEQPI